jgi:PucR family transcriptional regulator, purine catabolism regulatory protein
MNGLVTGDSPANGVNRLHEAESGLSITVRELLLLPHLQSELLAGGAGVDRPVSWVHTSDLPNAWEWHGSGELLLTNGTGLPADPERQADFATLLAGTGASGLAIGLGMPSPPLSLELTQRADELGLPLITVPFSVPFTAVVRAVADANDREESLQVLQVARLYELLRQSIAAGASGPGLLPRLGRELGVRLFLVDPATGGSLLEDGEETAYATALAAGFAAHGGALPGMLTLSRPGADHRDVGAVAVAVPASRPTALVVEPLGDQLPSTVLLQHAAAGGALELAQLTARQERQRRAGADLFTQLLDRRIDERAAREELAEFDLPLAEAVVIAVSAGSEAAARTGSMLARQHLPHLLLSRGDRLYLLMTDRALAEPRTADWSAPIEAMGISDLVGTTGRVPEACQEAGWALAAAIAQDRKASRYGEESILLPRTPTEARSVVNRVLGPLLVHDADRGSEFLTTVRVLLEHDRSWQQAAAALHIHKQTLGYRLRRVEGLTGRGFTRTPDIAEWWVALQANDLLLGSLPPDSELRP